MPPHAGVGICHVNPKFQPTSDEWNLGWTWKFPTPAWCYKIELSFFSFFFHICLFLYRTLIIPSTTITFDKITLWEVATYQNGPLTWIYETKTISSFHNRNYNVGKTSSLDAPSCLGPPPPSLLLFSQVSISSAITIFFRDKWRESRNVAATEQTADCHVAHNQSDAAKWIQGNRRYFTNKTPRIATLPYDKCLTYTWL